MCNNIFCNYGWRNDFWKNANGTLQAIPSKTAGQSEFIADDKKSGIAVGNDTVNPIFAYGIAQTGSGYVETAQLK